MGTSIRATGNNHPGSILSRWLIAALFLGALLVGPAGAASTLAGGTTQGSPSDVVDLYDHATRQWTTATLSVARTAPGTATLGTKILVAGGYEGSGQASRAVDVYDTATRTWSATSLTHPWSGDTIITVGTKVLFPGPETVDVFDAESGEVKTAALSQPRSGAAPAVVGSRVLFAGGVVGDGKVPSGVVDLYDGATDTWSTAELSQPRSDIKVAVVEGRAIFAGGVTGDGPTDVVDVYDATTGSWSTAHLSEARRGIAVATVGSMALFAGGSNRTGNQAVQHTAVVDLYDGATGTWTTAKLSEARSLFAATAGSQALFASTRACVFRPECPRRVDVYDGRTGTWSTTELHAPRVFSPGLVGAGRRVGGLVVGVGSQILFVGGADSATGGGGGVYYGFLPGNSVHVYDTQTGEWSEGHLSGRVYTPTVRVADPLVAFAGHDGGAVRIGPNPSSAAATAVRTVDLYDSSTGEWIVGSLSTPRRELGVAVLGRTAIFAGGTVGEAE